VSPIANAKHWLAAFPEVFSLARMRALALPLALFCMHVQWSLVEKLFYTHPRPH